MVAGIVFVGAKVLPQTTFEKKTFNHEKKTSCSYWQNRQDFLDKIKVWPRIVSPRFGEMIEVQLVQKSKEKNYPKNSLSKFVHSTTSLIT